MDVQRSAIEQARYPKLTRLSAGALAVWLLALVFGAAFWALLFHFTLRW
jgi:hypothetical protein